MTFFSSGDCVCIRSYKGKSQHPPKKRVFNYIIVLFFKKKKSDELLFSSKFEFCFSCVQPYIAALLLLLPGSTENWIRGLIIIYFLNFIRQAIVTKQKKELKRKEKKPGCGQCGREEKRNNNVENQPTQNFFFSPRRLYIFEQRRQLLFLFSSHPFKTNNKSDPKKTKKQNSNYTR